MTKQEQIEEMAHIMCEHYNKGFCAKGDITEICEDMPYCCYKNEAEALYDAGYRKAGELRKETAKEFAEKVKMAFYYEFDEIIPSIMADKIDELLKEYEIEE